MELFRPWKICLVALGVGLFVRAVPEPTTSALVSLILIAVLHKRGDLLADGKIGHGAITHQRLTCPLVRSCQPTKVCGRDWSAN
jgi:hypothetical protein